jgi:fucose permease
MTTTTHDAGRLVRTAATWFGYILVSIQIYFFTVQGNVIPFLQNEFSLNYSAVALHSAAMAAGVIVIGLVGARIVSALGRRRTLLLAACGLAGGGVLLCISPGPWASIPSCLIIGLAGGISSSNVPAMMADIHGERRSQAITEQSIFAYTFAILGPIITGICVAAGLGWRTAVFAGAFVGIALILVYRWVVIPPSQSAARPRGSHARLSAAFWAYWVLFAFAIGLEFSTLLWAPAFLERVIGFSAAAAATAAAGFFLGVLTGRLVVRAIVRRFNPRHILLVAYLIGIAGFIAYWAIATKVSAIVGIFMLGLGVAPQYPMIMSLGIGAARGANDAGATRMVLAFGLSFLIAPVALGALADRVGLGPATLTLPVLMAGAVVSLLIAISLERRALSPA